MNIAHWLERTAARLPDKDAVFEGAAPLWRYADLVQRTRAIAAGLQASGAAQGDRVAIYMDNVPDYLPVFYGIWWMGAVAVPINAKLHPREVAWILQNAEASVVFATAAKASELRDIGATVQIIDTDSAAYSDLASTRAEQPCASAAPDDLAWLFYTSGTTGRPKGVMITHGMIEAMALSYFADADEVRAEDAALYAAPMSHGAGLYNVMHVLKGARHVFPVSRGFDPAEIFELSEHHGSVHMFAAPTMVKRLTDVGKASGQRGTGIRTIVYAGGPMYLADITRAVDWFGDIFVQIYGQGECPMGITALPRADVSDRSHPDWQARLGSVGVAQSGVEVHIGDAAGKAVPRGAVGEIMVRGRPVMPGYWRNPEATAKTLKGGWLWTGDMGRMDDAGYVTMVDRSKDMIISGGSNVYPREVEEVLLTHPSVREVSVVGRPHPEWGEEVVAFVVCDGALDAPALDALCLEQIARFKRPKDYFALPELPKNNYGKVLKTELRAQLAQEGGARGGGSL